MRKRKLKLFVWTEFCPDYRGGLAFAIAKDEASAKSMITDELGVPILDSEWGALSVYSLSKPIAKYVAGGD